MTNEPKAKWWTGEEAGAYTVPNGEDRGPVTSDDLRKFMADIMGNQGKSWMSETLKGYIQKRERIPQIYLVSTPDGGRNSVSITHAKELAAQHADYVLLDMNDIRRENSVVFDGLAGLEPAMIIVDECHLDAPETWCQYGGRGLRQTSGESWIKATDYARSYKLEPFDDGSAMPLRLQEQEHKARLKDHATSPRKGDRRNKGGRR